MSLSTMSIVHHEVMPEKIPLKAVEKKNEVWRIRKRKPKLGGGVV